MGWVSKVNMKKILLILVMIWTGAYGVSDNTCHELESEEAPELIAATTIEIGPDSVTSCMEACSDENPATYNGIAIAEDLCMCMTNKATPNLNGEAHIDPAADCTACGTSQRCGSVKYFSAYSLTGGKPQDLDITLVPTGVRKKEGTCCAPAKSYPLKLTLQGCNTLCLVINMKV